MDEKKTKWKYIALIEKETVERKIWSQNSNKKVEPKQSHWRKPKCIECKKPVQRKIVSWNKNMSIAHKMNLRVKLNY